MSEEELYRTYEVTVRYVPFDSPRPRDWATITWEISEDDAIWTALREFRADENPHLDRVAQGGTLGDRAAGERTSGGAAEDRRVIASSRLRLRDDAAEEGGDRLPEAQRQAHERHQGHVELAALDLLQVLQVEVAPLCGLFERPSRGLTKPPQPEPERLRLTSVPSGPLVDPRRSLLGLWLRRHPPRKVPALALGVYLTCDERPLTPAADAEDDPQSAKPCGTTMHPDARRT